MLLSPHLFYVSVASITSTLNANRYQVKLFLLKCKCNLSGHTVFTFILLTLIVSDHFLLVYSKKL